MTTSKKQISISTNLSNNSDISYNYADYRKSIICRYKNSNYDTLINPVFTTFIDNVINNDDSLINIVDINNYKSKSPFNLIYNITRSLEKFDDLIFNNCYTLTGVTHISDSFKSIGKYAFNGCKSLTFINMPNTIEEIKEFAFNGTINLKSLDISNIIKLHNYSFAGSGIEVFDLNNKITALNPYLFKDCKNLTSFINDNILLIGEGVFCGCTNLEYVELSNFAGILTNDEYVETIEEIKEDNEEEEKDIYEIGTTFLIDFLDDIGVTRMFGGTIETIDNISSDDFLSRLARFVITDSTDESMIGKTFYVGYECLEDESGEHFYYFYNEDGTVVGTYTMRLAKNNEDEPIPPSKWILYDNKDNLIGNISEELMEKLKAYDEANNNNIISSKDNGDGTELLQFKTDIIYVEYYADGITLTGKTYNTPDTFQSYDKTQYIKKYQYFNDSKENGNIIELTDDLHVNLVFTDDFSECHVKLNAYPIYDASDRYIGYYMFEPFLALRKKYDENLIPKDGTNNNAYIDNGLYIKYEGIVAKYPVYNVNYCYLGKLTNGEWLDYTNQTELDTYNSKLDTFYIVDDENERTGLQYFMMPTSYNYSEYDIQENTIEATIAAIKEIIFEIIEYKTGSYPEEEEYLIQFDKFDLNDLEYNHIKYDLPNMLFAGCIKINNNNILKAKNYNPDISHVNIKFTNTLCGTNVYLGEWQDIIGFLFYSPSTVAYNYTFKWKYITYLDQKYINIILNNKNYFIVETYNNTTHTYERELVDNIYNTPTIVEKFESNALSTTESIFNINLFDNIYLMKFENLQKSIYDKYYLLDSIGNVGNNAFMGCNSIKEINNQFESIGDYAFKDCNNLKSIRLNKTTKIGHYAFQNCTNITNVSLNYLTSTKSEGIFYNCNNLKEIFNLSLSEIPKRMFKNCSSLNNINMININKVNNEAFYGCNNLLIDNLNNLNNITYFGDYSFTDCKNIKSIIFNDNIEHLGKGVFKGCTSLENVELPECITNFTDELFYGCKNLKSITFNAPINDEIILSGIDLCNNIESIHIPEGGRYITPNDTFIFDTQTNTIIYVCKNVPVITITNIYDITDIGTTINILNTAFNNCKVSIINISNNISTPNVNTHTFNGIKNDTYHILIDQNDSKYNIYYELVGKNHIYYI